MKNNQFYVQFGITLLLFSFFCLLAGAFHGFIAGFVGEYLYQLAYYNTVNFGWCFIIALWGFLCGIYKYRPLMFKDIKKIVISILILSINSLIIALIFILSYYISIPIINSSGDNILIIVSKFIIQTLITVIFVVPLLLFFYDKIFASKERHLYYMILTHHPISMSDHTFYLKFGRTYFYFCSRCSGVLIGGGFANFITHLIEKIYNIDFSPEIAVFLCIILPIPGLIDWGTQRMLLRKSTTKLRLLTGFVIGSALHFLSFTNKYYLFMIFILTLYFSILGIIMYFGHKKEMKLSTEDTNEMYIEGKLE
jgi:uncharacterized membrane protein